MSRGRPSRSSTGRNLSKRAVIVLSYLAERRGKMVTIEELADIIWPDHDDTPDTYQLMIYAAISELRSSGIPISNISGYML